MLLCLSWQQDRVLLPRILQQQRRRLQPRDEREEERPEYLVRQVDDERGQAQHHHRLNLRNPLRFFLQIKNEIEGERKEEKMKRMEAAATTKN